MIWLPLGQMSLGSLRRPAEWFTSNQFVSPSMILILIFRPKDSRTKMFNEAWVSHSNQVIKRVFVYQWIILKTIFIWIIIVAAMKMTEKNPHVVNRVTQLTSSHVWPTFTRATLKAIVAAAIAPSMCRHNCNNITFLQPLCHWHRQAWTLWAQRMLWHIEEVTPPQNRATASPSMFRWDIWWDTMILIFIHINMFVSYLSFMTSGDCESIISWNCVVLHRVELHLIWFPEIRFTFW